MKNRAITERVALHGGDSHLASGGLTIPRLDQLRPTGTPWFNARLPRVLPADWREAPEDLDENNRIRAICYRSDRGMVLMMRAELRKDGNHYVYAILGRERTPPTIEDAMRVKDIFLGSEAVALLVLPRASEWAAIGKDTIHFIHCVEKSPIPPLP